MDGASLRPSEMMEGGGLVDDQDLEITGARFHTWDYGKPEKGVETLAVELTLKDDEGTEYQQNYSAGDPTAFVPSEDGSRAIPTGTKTGLNNNTNLAGLMTSLINAGYPEDRLTDDITDLVGLKAHWNRVPQQERKGLVGGVTGQGGGRPAMTLQVTKIIKLPWDKGKAGAGAKAGASTGASAKAGATGKAAATTSKGAAASKAPASKTQAAAKAKAAQEAEEPADGEVDELTQKTRDALIAILEAEGGTTPKKGVSKLMFAQADGEADRGKMVRLVFTDEFLDAGQDAGLWMYDAEEGTIQSF